MSYSEQELISALQDLADRLGKTPSASDLRADDETPSRDPYRRVFGSWNDALTTAGLPPNQAYERDPDDLRDELVRLTRDIGRVPSEQDMDDEGRYAATTYRDHWGDWETALSELGLHWERDRPRNSPTDRELIEHLRDVANYHGPGRTARLSKRDLPDGGPAYSTYHTRFGSWRATLAAAGLPFPSRGYSHDDIMAAIRAVGDAVDKQPGDPAPTVAEFAVHSDISKAPVLREFDTWNEAVAAAGYDTNPDGRPAGSADYSTGYLLGELRRVADDLGRGPTHEEFQARSEINYKTILRRFESWPRAVRLVGYQPAHQSPTTPEPDRSVVDRAPGESTEPRIDELTVEASDQSYPIAIGDLLYDDRSNIGYEIVGIDCENTALAPDWAVHGQLIEADETHHRRFWPDELIDGLGDWILYFSGEER